MYNNIENYLGFSGRSSMGEVQTPNELAQEMINKLPEEIFINDKTTFLDPCFGSGTFLKEIALKLRKYGHSKENINSRLIGVEKSIRFINKIHQLQGFNPTLVHDDFLEQNFKNMKFDVVIMNPPFQDITSNSTNTTSLDTQFIQKAYNLSSQYVMSISSASWSSKSSNKFKNWILSLRQLELFKDIPSTTFNIALPTCYFMINKNHNSKITTVISNTEYKTYQNTSEQQNIFRYNSKEEFEIFNILKPYTSNPISYLWSRNNIKRNNPLIITTPTQGYVPMVDSVGRSGKDMIIKYHPNNIPTTNFNKWKVVMGNLGSYTSFGNLKIVPPNANTSFAIVSLGVDTKQQVINLYNYLCSDLVYFIISKNKLTTPNTKSILKNIPKVDFNQEWDNDKVYEFFGLSKYKSYIQSQINTKEIQNNLQYLEEFN